jgi:hypothetical protein
LRSGKVGQIMAKKVNDRLQLARMASVDRCCDVAKLEAGPGRICIPVDDADQARIEMRAFLQRDLECNFLARGHGIAVRIS